jgi:hypothetical protein
VAQLSKQYRRLTAARYGVLRPVAPHEGGMSGPDPDHVLSVRIARGLTFLGSAGLSHHVAAHAAAGPGVLRVVAGQRPRRSIEVTGLHTVLHLAPTVDDGLG